MTVFRPIDLAREHGISAQAVRNYEDAGILPAAERTDAGYRVYTERHVRALRTFLVLIPGFGHESSRRIMVAVNRGDIDAALATVDDVHHQLRADRATLRAVSRALADPAALAAEERRGNQPATSPGTIGAPARLLGITAATLRAWERAGILVPQRDRRTGYRVYRAADLRDAALARMLRRGGYPLAHIADVLAQIRAAGGTDRLSDTVDRWQRRLSNQGVAMLAASGALSDYLTVSRDTAASRDTAVSEAG